MQPLSSKCVTYFDFVRFFLAQIVVIGHGFGFYFGYWNGFFPRQVPYLQSIAVVGFFFVSGFLICRSVLANIKYKGGSSARYFVDRFARIYTTLLPCLIFVLLVDSSCALFIGESDLQKNVNFDTFLNNFFLKPSMPFGTMRPIWSLMFEWWLYILFGGMVFFRKSRIVSILCIGLGGYYTFHVNSQGDAGHLEVIWFLGALLAFYFDKLTKITGAKYIAAFALLASMAVYLKTLDAYNIFAGILLSVGMLFLAVVYNADRAVSRPIISSVFDFMASYSFTLFLTHYTVLFWLQKAGWTGLKGIVLAVLVSNLVAMLIAYFTERHHKALSVRLLQSISTWRGKLA